MTTTKAPGREGHDLPGGLEVADLSVRFGGLVAVDHVSLHVPLGRLTGLIGPNGAGKTTTFDACTGRVRPDSGRVALFGHDVTRRGPAARAQLGLARTFQVMQLFDSMTVRENVALGREAQLAGSHFVRQIVPKRSDRRVVREAADHALALCGLDHLADRRAGALSTGQRRLVELARIVAGDFRVLLLDEPSSGLDVNAVQRFGAVLRRLIDERGTGVLLVEHDMQLIMGMCDYVYVLDFGAVIFEGAPAEVAASETVRKAYLGGDIDRVRAD